ncbi:hypothetical protein ALC62_13452 [Cyphomyrmex costatus]|uniref:DUF8207 domain-containing protein n=1 Tax=Cyphomyrmex costatus TaxID=456900 RepID=A0A151IA03_9HYME|nr:hypothetical protein ALC62_13452 [Cyphomyrmex costatus]
MDSSKELKDRERIAKTSDSIRKEYRALKTGKIDEDIALEKHFKPVVEPLKQMSKTLLLARNLNRLRKKSTVRIEDVYKTPNEPLETLVKQSLQTRQFCEELNDQLGPLGQKYVYMLLSGDREKAINHVHSVYLNENDTMLGDKRFDVDTNDFVIIDGVKYKGTPGLYELIFKRIPDDAIYTENDKLAYKSILLATNGHRRSHNADNPILGNKGYKYKYIIAPIVSSKIQVRTDIPCALNNESGKRNGGGKGVIPLAMTLNDNKIDYIHWDDPNELVDRLRLLEASRQAGHNAHDNEILSIIEELREAGLIIN